MYLQCSPFVSAQQLGKRVFQTGRALAGIIPLLCLLSAFYGTEICHIFNPFHTDTFTLTSSRTQGSEFDKMNGHEFFSLTS